MSNPQNFALNVPVVDGVGAPTDLTLGGTFNPGAPKTALLDRTTDPFVGQLFLDISGDGVSYTVWKQLMPGAGEYTAADDGILANFIRVRRAGTGSLGATPLPIINLLVAAAPSAVPSGIRAFTRVIAQPADGSDFFVNIPAPPMPTDAYVVTGAQSGGAVIVGLEFPDTAPADRTTTQFRVITSAALSSGDTIDFVLTLKT
jgi:hypothetical protein